MVLLGDQMQLGQPIQGSHPGESGRSALEYLLEDKRTIPAHLGVFLGTTWRLHPELCSFVSGAVYEDKLYSQPDASKRTIRVGARGAVRVRKEAGIVFVPVHHEGNAQASDEEVAEIAAILEELQGRELTDTKGDRPKSLTHDDVLVVAPYTMQVRALRAALGRVRVGFGRQVPGPGGRGRPRLDVRQLRRELAAGPRVPVPSEPPQRRALSGAVPGGRRGLPRARAHARDEREADAHGESVLPADGGGWRKGRAVTWGTWPRGRQSPPPLRYRRFVLPGLAGDAGAGLPPGAIGGGTTGPFAAGLYVPRLILNASPFAAPAGVV